MGENAVNVVIGVSDAKTSADKEEVLITHALGSCIGVTVYDAEANVGGMLHFQLPSSNEHPGRGQEKPLMFADTGMAWLLDGVVKLGANKKRLRVHLAGAAKMLNDQTLFDIGRRNYAAVRRIFWNLGMFIDSEHVGGNTPRTMWLRMADGKTVIKCDGKETAV
jgi:chemotaxis protein CheD